MKKQVLLRGFLGFFLGIAIGYIITIFISLSLANGYYSSCVPALIEIMGNEINAVILQTILCGFLGSAFAASSVIWEMENWSIAKRTGIYFFIATVVMLPIAYFTNWMDRSFIGFISYFAIFVSVFIFIWFVQYFIWKSNLKKIQNSVSE